MSRSVAGRLINILVEHEGPDTHRVVLYGPGPKDDMWFRWAGDLAMPPAFRRRLVSEVMGRVDSWRSPKDGKSK